MKFSYPNIDQTESPKFRYGDKVADIDSYINYTFSFAFDYISLNQTELCFDHDNLDSQDYCDLFDCLKRISTIPLSTLFNNMNSKNNAHHFHPIILNREKRLKLLNPLKELLKVSYIDFNEMPTLYQIAVYTDNENQIAPRIVGFFGKSGIFHLLWFDFEHSIYPSKKQ